MPKSTDNKTISVTVYFFTDDLADQDGDVIPGHAWAQGQVAVRANATHSIKSGYEVMFNRMADLPAAIEDALIAAGVTLHLPGAPAKLYAAKP
jgi:hypothetical protein